MHDHDIHEHHDKAAHHHEHAAKHHREAAKHHKAGDHEKAAHHSKVAHGHHLHATEHHEHASKMHAEEHGEYSSASSRTEGSGPKRPAMTGPAKRSRLVSEYWIASSPPPGNDEGKEMRPPEGSFRRPRRVGVSVALRASGPRGARDQTTDDRDRKLKAALFVCHPLMGSI
jgi:hypothetical protein